MAEKPRHYAQFDAPDLAPVIACEHTSSGWRGLTEDGEILNVQVKLNGAPVVIPDSIAVSRNGEIIGYRAVKEIANEVISKYERHLNASITLVRATEFAHALEEIDSALGFACTQVAKHNRAVILLHLGRWKEGFEQFAGCEQTALFMRPQYRAAIEHGLPAWYGEDLAGKKLLLVHAHGFGDTIMMLRYVPRLRLMGAEVVLQVPPELERLAAQVAPVTRELVDADCFCPILSLLRCLHETPETVTRAPYLKVDPVLVDKWHKRLEPKRKPIGVAWSVGVPHDDDYPRPVPLGLFCKALGNEGDLISVQQQSGAEADMLGVEHYQFEDFADCAALMSLMDEIVTVDTAAVHLAGAIGHPRISLLLSHWSSWRWQAPFYENVILCRQDSPGDWESAFAKRVM